MELQRFQIFIKLNLSRIQITQFLLILQFRNFLQVQFHRGLNYLILTLRKLVLLSFLDITSSFKNIFLIIFLNNNFFFLEKIIKATVNNL